MKRLLLFGSIFAASIAVITIRAYADPVETYFIGDIQELGGAFDGTFTANADLDGYDLALDTDGDTGLVNDRDAGVADDEIDIKIATAVDFTFKANALELVAGSILEGASAAKVSLGTDGAVIVTDNAGTSGVCMSGATDNILGVYDDADCSTGGTLLLGNGAVGAPAIARVGDAHEGIYFIDNAVKYAKDGAERLSYTFGSQTTLDWLNVSNSVKMYRNTVEFLEASSTGVHVTGLNQASKSIVMPQGTALPGTCTAGSIYYDTDSDDCSDTGAGDGCLCLCKTTNTWGIIINI